MFYSVPTNHNCLDVYSESVPQSRATLRICNNLVHMWHHVTNHLIISNDKDFNSENRIKLRVRDTVQQEGKGNQYQKVVRLRCKIPCFFSSRFRASHQEDMVLA
jgi:hypothetical protein